MNRMLVKDQNGNVLVLTTSGMIPEGLEAVPQEELADAELEVAKSIKMAKIRSERDQRLIDNDKQWLIKSKKGESTAALEAEAQTLRDLPEAAQEALDELESVEEIQSYDAFGEL